MPRERHRAANRGSHRAGRDRARGATMKFFVGIAKAGHARHLPAVMLSATTLRTKKRPFEANEWILDSGAFTTIARFGGYPDPVDEYAAIVRKFATCGRLL